MSRPEMATDYDDADKVRSCTRKKGYPSAEIARLSVSAILRVNPSASVHAYGCRHCGKWHVGGSPVSMVPNRFADSPDAVSRVQTARSRGEHDKPERRDREARLSRSRARRRDEGW